MKLVALYMMIRVFKVVMDISDSKGKVSEEGVHRGFLILMFFMSFILATLYILDNKVLSVQQWEALNWFFGYFNLPNDTIFRDLLFKRL